MGTDIHYLILQFFNERMANHSKVISFSNIGDSDNILYRIQRSGELSDLTVHLSDAYIYTLSDYYSKPSLLTENDFILVAKPEATYDDNSENAARNDHIGIGKIAKLMGALNFDEIWKYSPK